MDVEGELRELKRRMDDGESGRFSGFTKTLIDDFRQVQTDVRTLMDERNATQGVEKAGFTKREKLLFWVSIGSLLLALSNRLELFLG